MNILDIISESEDRWKPLEPGAKIEYDKDGNYVKGSYLRSVGINPSILDWNPTDTNTASTTTPGTPDSGKLAKPTSDTPKGATEDQMKRFGPSSKAQIDWHAMRDYVKSKLSFNHAVAMVVNSKFESQWMPGRWVHSDAKQGPSGGLFMFHDANFNGTGFFSSMVQSCGGPGKWQTNWQAQIDFALSSNIGKGPAFASTKFKTPEEATHWFCYYFERPQNYQHEATERAKLAQHYSK
jgi:hypothetical protein